MADTSPGPAEKATVADRLDSWKEIAAYLRRGLATVQRWEKQEGLPVHRHLHGKLGSVWARKSEIDAWWGERRPQLEGSPGSAAADSPLGRLRDHGAKIAVVTLALPAVLLLGFVFLRKEGL